MKLSSHFTTLPMEKQERIINAALKEFASGGYDKASTNALCRSAGISKGSLFQYFGSKKELFLQLFYYCEEMIGREVGRAIKPETTDLLERYRQKIRILGELILRFPVLMDFVRTAKLDESPEISADIEDIKRAGNDVISETLIEGADFRLFREELDRESILFVIDSALKAKMYDQIREELDLDRFYSETDRLLDLFRASFYKTGVPGTDNQDDL